MPDKKNKPFLSYSIPREMVRYRNINNSSGYIPYVFTQTISGGKDDLIIVDEDYNGSSEE